MAKTRPEKNRRNAGQFKAGQSGNPRGRQPGVPNKVNVELKALAQQYTQESIETLVGILRSVEHPPAARVAACREVLDRGHGKAPQALTDADGGPLTSAIVNHIHLGDGAKP